MHPPCRQARGLRQLPCGRPLRFPGQRRRGRLTPGIRQCRISRPGLALGVHADGCARISQFCRWRCPRSGDDGRDQAAGRGRTARDGHPSGTMFAARHARWPPGTGPALAGVDNSQAASARLPTRGSSCSRPLPSTASDRGHRTVAVGRYQRVPGWVNGPQRRRAFGPNDLWSRACGRLCQVSRGAGQAGAVGVVVDVAGDGR